MIMENIEQLYRIYLECNGEVCTDTRKIKQGALFFALKGENFNANAFAAEAIHKGCLYAVVDEAEYQVRDKIILVRDCLKSLQELASYHRNQLSIPIIAITGSNGKTTTKELVYAVLSKKYHCLATEGNLNNHIGVPLTLLSIRKQHQMAIIEMGANHQGEIDFLCKLADPDYGIITNIGKAHLEGFGGIEGVKKGKSELYKYINQKNGKVFIHADDAVLTELAQNNFKITYGTHGKYEVVGKLNETTQQVEFKWVPGVLITSLNDTDLVQTKLVGVYNYYNLLCAACVGITFGVTSTTINEALQEYTPSNNRSQLHKTKFNSLILDYYNANPTSMAAAIENFANMAAGEKFLVLGDMLELGEETNKEHQAIIELLEKKGLNNYLLVGKIFHAIARGKSVINSVEAAEKIEQQQLRNQTVLIKGSRGIKLEEVVKVL